MKKTLVLFSGMLAAAASFSAAAKTPEWFILKHPEVKIMERMQAQAAAKARRQQIAMHNADLHHAIDQTTGNDSHNS